jgi:hypothetical protein
MSLWFSLARLRPCRGRPSALDYAVLAALIVAVCALTPLFWAAYELYEFTLSRR